MKNKMPLRTAVIGCGALAHGAHLPNIKASQLMKLTMVCDINAEKAQQAARDFGSERVTTKWQEVVAAPDIDLIVLCTHLELRAEAICAALAVGKAVYTEKPMASSREEAQQILRAAHATGVPVCVGHNRRSSPAICAFKRLFKLAHANGTDRPAIIDRNSGEREQLEEERQCQLLIRINDDARTWKFWAFEDEQGIMLGEMTHFIDLALWLIPSTPVEVYAMGSPRGNFTQLLRFADGSIATLQHTMVGNFDYPKERYEATVRNVSIGLDHLLELTQRGLDTEPARQVFPLGQGAELTDCIGMSAFWDATDKLQALRQAGKPLPVPHISPEKGHFAHLEAFVHHIQGEGPNPCPPEDTAAVNNIALKLIQSARIGQPVHIGPEDYDFVRADWAALKAHWL